MSTIQRHTHSIEISFMARGFLLLRVTIPIKLKSQIKISEWFELTKKAIASAHGIPVWQIKGKHKKIESKYFDRILFEWAGGISIDLPNDCSSYDYEIILHYLEGVKMSLGRP